MALAGQQFGSLDAERLAAIERLIRAAVFDRCADTGWIVGHVPGIVGTHAQGETTEEVIDQCEKCWQYFETAIKK